jgi:ATP-dependent DNA helicase RecG
MPSTTSGWIELLTDKGLMTEDSLGNPVCTIAGLLCFGLKPRRFLNEAGLRVMSFSGLDKDYQTQLNMVLDAPLRREKTWFYPRDAVRELAINALAHQDWTRPIDIEVTNYGNRLEIISPGAFVNSMNVKKMIGGQRSYRNQLIAGILRDYGYIDGRGMGVRTKVIPLMRSLNKTDSIFEATEDYVKIILPRKGA